MQIKYSSYLRHMNENHDPKTGQFTFSTMSSLGKESKRVTDSASSLVDRFGKTKKQPRADLSGYSNKELQEILTREELERRYDTYFNTPTERKGAEYAKTILSIAGVAATTIGAIGTLGMVALGAYEKFIEPNAKKA